MWRRRGLAAPPLGPLRRAAAAVLLGGLLLAAPAAGGAEPPLATVRRHVEAGLAILRADGERSPEGLALQRRRLAERLAQAFDFSEFTRLALGAGGARFRPAERREFEEVFTAFLSEYYLAQLQTLYAGETVEYLRERIAAPGRAVVELALLWRGRRIPVEVRLLDRGEGWKAYDVAVLGVSAVMLYRAQLAAILQTRTPAETIALIRARLAE